MKKYVLEKLLSNQESELSERIKKIRREIDTRHISKKLSQQNIERANDDVIANLENEAQEKLALTRQALQRLDQGDFGYCLECHVEISDERLTSLPHTSFCSACATRSEAVNR